MKTWWRSGWGRASALAAISLGTLFHARYYDFSCDDAFIALRYAQHLVEHHELAYNLGQRVEGFTSPLWVLLVAAVASFGVPVVAAAKVLGGLAVPLGMGAVGRFWDELEPEAPWLVLLPAVALSLCAPFAAWTFGGLETPLFVALFTLSLAQIARATRRCSPIADLHAGLSVALCTLCRPEAATLIALGSVALALSAPRAGAARIRRLLAWGGPIALLVGGYELFRWAYYGSLLPNTFYVKTSGDGLWQRGMSYLGFAASELGWPLVLACTISIGYLSVADARSSGAARPRPCLAICTSAATAIHLLYVAAVGGDFLDLYRFLVPLLPAALCCLTCAGYRSFVRFHGAPRFALLAVATCSLVAHGLNQYALALRAMRVAHSSRAALRLEPLGWTRLYARRWQGIGSWLAQIRVAGDSTAVGAAGALPFFSELPNLDLFGLNDSEIARHGRVIGNRPGHQRFATMDYLLAQKPTFIFMNPESTPSTPTRLRYDRYWTSHGYVPIEIRVDRQRCDCPETFYHQFFVRRERADSLRAREDAVVGRGAP